MKIYKSHLKKIIREAIDHWYLEKMSVAKEARQIAKERGDRKLEALAHALELSLGNGVVIAQGSPFYGVTTQELEKEIAKSLSG